MPNSPQTLFHAAMIGDVVSTITLLGKKSDPLKTDGNGRIPLHFALMLPMIYAEELRNNKIKVAEELIKQIPQSVSCKDNSGDTPFHDMASGGFDTLLASALRSDPKVALLKNKVGVYPIHNAIAAQQYRTSALLLAIPGMSDLLDYRGRSLIHHAAMMNNLPVLKQLLDVHHHALPHAHNLDADNQTALDIAMDKGFEQIVDFLECHADSRPMCS